MVARGGGAAAESSRDDRHMKPFYLSYQPTSGASCLGTERRAVR